MSVISLHLDFLWMGVKMASGEGLSLFHVWGHPWGSVNGWKRTQTLGGWSHPGVSPPMSLTVGSPGAVGQALTCAHSGRLRILPAGFLAPRAGFGQEHSKRATWKLYASEGHVLEDTQQHLSCNLAQSSHQLPTSESRRQRLDLPHPMGRI